MRVHFDARLGSTHINGHHVEPARAIDDASPCEKLFGQARDPLLLLASHGRAAAPERIPRPRFHLDEHQRLASLRDDVNFSVPTPVATLENCVPAALQLGTRELFPDFPQRLTADTCHALPERTSRANLLEHSSQPLLLL